MNNIQDAIDFLRMHGVLKDWDTHKIAAGMNLAINTCCWSHSVDPYGNIDGLVFGRWIEPAKHIFVIAAVGKGKLRLFFDFLRRNFPECRKISYMRHGVEKIMEF
jgi:hypothetical protein